MTLWEVQINVSLLELPCNIAGAVSLFLNIAGAIAPVAPVLNTPLPSLIFRLLPSFSHLAELAKFK
jgi:hypothetical protein